MSGYNELGVFIFAWCVISALTYLLTFCYCFSFTLEQFVFISPFSVHLFLTGWGKFCVVIILFLFMYLAFWLF